jgi:hypothetical protein
MWTKKRKTKKFFTPDFSDYRSTGTRPFKKNEIKKYKNPSSFCISFSQFTDCRFSFYNMFCQWKRACTLTPDFWLDWKSDTPHAMIKKWLKKIDQKSCKSNKINLFIVGQISDNLLIVKKRPTNSTNHLK